MRLFQYDAPLWRAVSTIGDLIVLNLLACICALPVVTAGASLTALADTSRRMAQGEGTAVWRMFLTSFRRNFRTASLAWAVVGPVALVLLAAWIFVQADELIVLKALISAVLLLGFPFLWSLIARFDNTVGAHLKNAWLVAIGNLPLALGVLAIHAGMIALVVATAYYLPAGFPVLLLLGVSLPWVASAPLIERAFRPLLDRAS
ncbi:YesL family protein [Tessaracoccus lacteus]|uniref:YesL family protein n=1 Tax=Tessaracoccus lacteus TaxID=3041766 RepID=A0ABY8PYH7_9ACTN|nr:YesL family protein [Tessaracoccus sp. T21]WGT47560.1 YesL family protein [Tessaracoccus sp. T21]